MLLNSDNVFYRGAGPLLCPGGGIGGLAPYPRSPPRSSRSLIAPSGISIKTLIGTRLDHRISHTPLRVVGKYMTNRDRPLNSLTTRDILLSPTSMTRDRLITSIYRSLLISTFTSYIILVTELLNAKILWRSFNQILIKFSLIKFWFKRDFLWLEKTPSQLFILNQHISICSYNNILYYIYAYI